MRKNIEFSEWCRKCPECNSDMYYTNKYKLNDGVLLGSVCKKCKYKKISRTLSGKCLSDSHKQSLKNGWIHRKRSGYIHHMMGKYHSEETKQKMVLAKQKYNPWLGKHHSEETKQKMSDKWKQTPRNMLPVILEAIKYNTGKVHSIEHNKRISDAIKGKKHSDETKSKICQKLTGIVRREDTKEKLRILRLQQISDQGVVRCFNKNACDFIDAFGIKRGFSFIHGNNGGEIMLNGYMVDGYDKERNIVFEYDEDKHEAFKQKMKDLKRTDRIISKIGCKILRYSQKYNRFYWSFPDRSEIFIST